MVKRVLLHIGMHKSGTTALQASLKGFDDGQSFYGRLSHENHSIPLVTIFGSDPENFLYWKMFHPTQAELNDRRNADLETLKAELGRSDRETLILSAEDVSGLPKADKAAVIRFLKAHVSEIEVVCYVRDPLSFAASMFQQRAKWHGRYFPIAQGSLAPRYTRRIEPFIELLGREHVRVVAFDRGAFANGNVVDDFAQRFGLKNVTAQRANESMSLSALRLLLAFNSSSPLNMGDRILTPAKTRLIEDITGAYADGAPLDKALFRCVADFSETAYLRDTFDIDFVPGTTDRPALGAADLEACLTDLGPVDPAPLDACLKANGLETGFTDFPEKLNRLYYHHVAAITAQAGGNPRFLTFADGDLLRDTGIALARGETLTPETALALLDMAVRAKPAARPLREVRDALRARLDAKPTGRAKAP